jgi:hypothetical protein
MPEKVRCKKTSLSTPKVATSGGKLMADGASAGLANILPTGCRHHPKLPKPSAFQYGSQKPPACLKRLKKIYDEIGSPVLSRAAICRML